MQRRRGERSGAIKQSNKDGNGDRDGVGSRRVARRWSGSGVGVTLLGSCLQGSVGVHCKLKLCGGRGMAGGEVRGIAADFAGIGSRQASCDNRGTVTCGG